MRLGILADTHDEDHSTRTAIASLQAAGADALIHCGDLTTPGIIKSCAVLPFWFVFGNHDADNVPTLLQAATDYRAVCLGWGGIVTLAKRRIGVVHGHMTSDVRPLLALQPDYLLCGHSHLREDRMVGDVRRINPGALHRADQFTVALLDLASSELRWLTMDE